MKIFSSRRGTPTKPVHTAHQSARDGDAGDGKPPVTDSGSDVTGYEDITDVGHLQKLLAQSASAEERHRIRNAIRQLRQADIGMLADDIDATLACLNNCTTTKLLKLSFTERLSITTLMCAIGINLHNIIIPVIINIINIIICIIIYINIIVMRTIISIVLTLIIFLLVFFNTIINHNYYQHHQYPPLSSTIIHYRPPP
ncbi:hypothetical protein ElyMa_001876700 [Elysia marginata]|uniref:Smoothelin domain-containing protein n=1 Tax=Elysia marginata TaxID=1093978 RepID=A0AAV4EPT3_9GAST|nr:hypothetical protein ElyMa_001876700 [Elysia marginata]